MKNFKWMLFAAVLTFAACGDDESSDTALDCGQGDVISVDDDTYCVYPQEVVVENGFDCPPMVPNLTSRGPIGVCSDRPMVPGEALDRIDERYREERPDLYQCMMNSDCANGQVCQNGVCTSDSPNNTNNTNNSAECSSSTDCESSETCEDGACVPVCGGFAGFTCAADEWCDYPDDASCGIADQLGICRPRPEACAQILDEVCGCDGTTYSNECVAKTEGVDVAASGPCM